MTYELLRQTADSWGMLFLGLLFLIAVWFALRPSARDQHRDSSQIPFRDERPRDD